MAVAAATAVITPAAFLMAAPAAFAEETTSPTPTASESSAETTAPAPTGSETTAPAPTQSETTAPAPTQSETTAPAPTGSETTAPAPTGSNTTAPSPSNTVAPSPSTSEDEDVCKDFADNAGVHTELRGLPSKVVAGSGWQEFTFRVANKTDKDLDAVEAYVQAYAFDNKDFDDISSFITLQANIGDGWETITEEFGYFGTAPSLKPGEYVDAALRLKVDAKAPAGFGVAFAAGVNVSKDGLCEFGDETEYEFEVLAAGTKPGNVDDAKGKPGKDTNKPAPQGELSEMPVTGSLANTGSSSMLPTIGIAGGVAIVAGAGVVFALKRRNAGATA